MSNLVGKHFEFIGYPWREKRGTLFECVEDKGQFYRFKRLKYPNDAVQDIDQSDYTPPFYQCKKEDVNKYLLELNEEKK